MLKIRYSTETKILSGWTDIESEFDQLQSRGGEDTAILDIAKPSAVDYEDFLKQDGELVRRVIEPSEPPRSTHISAIDAIDISKVRPVRIKRVWKGNDYFYNCFVTESVKDQYLAGDIAVGDFALVEFLDDDPNRAVVFSKVLKTW